jgi:hypothetical protein
MDDDIPGRVFAEDPDIIDLSIRLERQNIHQEQAQIEADKEWLNHMAPVSDTTPLLAADMEWLDRMDPLSDTTPLPEYADLTGLPRSPTTNVHLGSKGKKKMDKDTQSRSGSSSPTNTADTYIAYYKATIATDFSPKSLAHSPLPNNRELLQEVSEYMVEEMYKRYVIGFYPLLPPVNHPLYPFWVREHQGNYAVTAMLAKEKAETEY